MFKKEVKTMHKKKLFKLALVSAVLCVMFCGCGKDNSDNKKTADNIASSTDVTIDNTDIASADSSEISESNSTTTEANTTNSASGGIETESSNAINDDDTNNNDNKPNNGENSGNNTTDGTKPSTTESTQPSTTTDNTYPSTTEDTKPETPTTEESKPEVPSTTETPTTEEHSECQHKWILVDETIHHDAVYETQTVCVQEAYDEPIYEYHSFCNGCGMDLTINFPNKDYSTHTYYCQGGSTYHTKEVLVNTIHHEAVYETKEVCVQEAWDEIVTHTVCSICGYQLN